MSRSRRCLYQTQGTWGSFEMVPSSYSATGGDMTGCVNLTRIFFVDGGVAKRTVPRRS